MYIKYKQRGNMICVIQYNNIYIHEIFLRQYIKLYINKFLKIMQLKEHREIFQQNFQGYFHNNKLPIGYIELKGCTGNHAKLLVTAKAEVKT